MTIVASGNAVTAVSRPRTAGSGPKDMSAGGTTEIVAALINFWFCSMVSTQTKNVPSAEKVTAGSWPVVADGSKGPKRTLVQAVFAVMMALVRGESPVNVKTVERVRSAVVGVAKNVSTVSVPADA